MLVSATTNGSFANGASTDPVITPDGTRVVFFSSAKNLVPGVSASSKGEIYLRDLVAGTTVWASTNAANVVSNLLRLTFMPSYHPALSDDGNFVSFKCGWTNGAVSPPPNPPITGVPKAVVFQFNIATGTSARFSTNAFPAWPYGDDVYGPEMTPDGRFITFVATNAAPTNSLSVQLWDTQTGSNILVSATLNGNSPTNTFSIAPVISPDGRFVAFLSNATNLVASVVSNGYHLYLRDLQLNTTQLVGANTNGIAAMDDWGAAPVFNANAQFVAFGSVDGSLIPADANNAHDVFVRDTLGGTTELISQANLPGFGASGNAMSSLGSYSLSADGRWAVFSSSASDLVTNDFNNDRDIFAADLQTGSNVLVSVGMDGNSASGGTSFSPVISADGHFVAFASSATNLVAGDTNRAVDIFLRDLQAGTTTLVSANSSGFNLGSGDASAPVISQDGRYVAFLAKTNVSVSFPSTFWRDTVAGTTISLAVASANNPTMSADGRRVAFFDSVSRLYVWDAQLAANIYTNAATITSAVLSPTGSRLLYQNQTAKQLAVLDLSSTSVLFSCTDATPIKSASPWSSDGRSVAFVTGAAIVSGDSNGTNDVFLCDLQTGTTTLISLNRSGTGSASGISDSPVISGDGRFVAFRSFATNVISGITNVPSLFLFDRTTGSNTVLATGSSGSWTFWVSPPVTSSSGNTIAFQSWDSGLVAGDLNRASDVFAQSQNILIADTDGDGIPDWWMLQYFGHATGQAGDSSRPQDDADGDGMSNLQEYIAGTNPTDASSVFRLQISSSISPTLSLKLNWPAVPGRNYQVQLKTNLTDLVWLNAAGIVGVLGGQGSFTVPFSSTQPSSFYRIVAGTN